MFQTITTFKIEWVQKKGVIVENKEFHYVQLRRHGKDGAKGLYGCLVK